MNNLSFFPVGRHCLLDFTANVPLSPVSDKPRRYIGNSFVAVIIKSKLVDKIKQKINQSLIAVIRADSSAVLGVFVFFNAHIPYVLRNGALLVGIIEIHSHCSLVTPSCNFIKLFFKSISERKCAVVGNKIGHRNIEPFHAVRHRRICSVLAVERHKAFHGITVSRFIFKLRCGESGIISADHRKAERYHVEKRKYFINQVHTHPPFSTIIHSFERRVNIQIS